MKSHEYQFEWNEVWRLLAAPLLCLATFVVLTHLAARSHLLPPPRPALDTDRTILLHQAKASREQHLADIILIGDSSCLMDIGARQLEGKLGGSNRVLNLATLSYVDLDGHGRLLRNYAAANPGKLKTVVLMMHPESLRLSSRNPYFGEVLENYLAGTDFCSPQESTLACWAGVPIWKGRVVTRVLPSPLAGAYGKFYGFTWDLSNFLTAHSGSAIDPRDFRHETMQGSAEYRLASQLEKPSRAFRASLPAGTRLLVGITPSPESFVLPGHAEKCRQMLEQWREWLGADGVLAPLPYSLRDEFFASTTHLNERGAEAYTDLMAAALRNEVQIPK